VFVDAAARAAAVDASARAAAVDDSVAGALAARLPDQPLVRVTAGAAYSKVSEDEYVIRPDAREDHDALIADLLEHDRWPEQIVYLWAVPAAEPEWTRTLRAGLERAPAWARPGVERALSLVGADRRRPRAAVDAGAGYDAAERLCFTALLHLAQAVGPLERPVALSIVTAGLHGLKADAPVDPARALVLGPARVIPREFPHVATRAIDLPGMDAPAARDASLDRLVEELSAAPRETVVALRGRDRFTQVFEPLPLAAAEGVPAAIRPGGVYVISGGTGGIGLEVGLHLARTARAKVVLLGRTPLPPRSRWSALAAAGGALGERLGKLLAIEAAGGEAMVAAADVTSRADMERVRARARARFGEVHGVVHSAGVLDDGLISLKAPEAARRVIAAKAKGALVLDEVFGRDGLELFVVFSSVSSVLGLEGQIDYTAANAFLDAFAERKSAEGRTHAVSMAWNAWQEIGMAAAIVDRPGGASAGAAAGGERAGAPAAGPWLERAERDTPAETLFVTSWSRTRQWVLGEHVVRGGEALIPGTGYLELSRAAFTREGFRPIEIRDLTFLAPFTVGAGQARDLRVRVARSAATAEAELTFFSDDERAPHVTGRVAAVEGAPPPRADLAAIIARCSARTRVFGGFLEQPFMDFGPRWENVDRVHFGADEAVIALALPDALVADLLAHPLHPGLLDMATGGAQPLLAATEAGFDPASDFYVPFAYGRFTAYRPLPARFFSHVRLRRDGGRDLAVFDATLYDPEGSVLAEVTRFTMKRVTRAFSTAAPGAGAPAAATASHTGFGASKLGSAVKLGILPAEGMDAFDRILAARVGGHVVASSVDLRDWMAQVDEQARPKGADAGAGGVGGADAGFERPTLGAAFVAPRNDVERTLAGMWRDVLGLKEVGVHDDFFELGGQSLVAVRLFNKIRKQYGVDLPLSTLFSAPTIESCARIVAHEAGLTLVDDAAAPGQPAAEAAPGDAPGAGEAPAQEIDPARWFYRPAWRQRRRERGAEGERLTWLAFLDGTGTLAALCERLRAEGHTVITVREGDAFHKLGDDEYQLFTEQGRDGYDLLFADLEANGRAPDRVLHAWLVTDEPVFRPGSSFFHRNLEAGFFSLLYLGQALAAHLARRPRERPLHLCAITSGAQRVGDEALPEPEKAAALGPLLVLPRELAGVTTTAIDVDRPGGKRGLLGRGGAPRKAPPAARGARAADDAAGTALLEALRAEVLAPPRDELVALRGSTRWVLGLERTALDGAPARPGFKERGVYLVTGGLDGPGAAIAQELARRYRARLVLVDAVALPVPGPGLAAWLAEHVADPRAARVERVLELEALGAEVLAAAAEVTDVERLREALAAAEARFGRVDGVVHAAGAPEETALVDTQLADVAVTFAPSVFGTRALAELLRDRPLDFFVTCSAAAKLAPAPGQTDDVAAAAFLDALADGARDRRVVSVAFRAGGKTDIGPAASPAGLTPAEELDALERVLRGSPFPSVVVSPTDLVALRAAAADLPSPAAAKPSRAEAAPRADDSPRPDLPRLMHLVKMHAGPALAKPPFFLVAGLFGNVLNLRSLAQLLGTDRPVYGLQARGLFGGLDPHESFEDMARDYLVELRTVQPHGPYYLGGFSGGGITAYEMARQLMDAGEVVRLVVLLDTPVPRREKLSAADRMSIQFQNLQREGTKYVTRWIESKLEYRTRLRRRAEQLRAQRGGETRDFHSQVIEAAFYRALARYHVRPLDVSVALFRPKIEPTYRLSGGRMLDKGRSALYADNGWTPYVNRFEIREVPGNHDSMVLEPHVRVLAARIDEAMARASAPDEPGEPKLPKLRATHASGEGVR
jgi:thioesterase domain-containing protein/NAD(P)-dependent dehydrogenase (short-subunit alcohol dehydrogenase family)